MDGGDSLKAKAQRENEQVLMEIKESHKRVAGALWEPKDYRGPTC